MEQHRLPEQDTVSSSMPKHRRFPRTTALSAPLTPLLRPLVAARAAVRRARFSALFLLQSSNNAPQLFGVLHRPGCRPAKP